MLFTHDVTNLAVTVSFSFCSFHLQQQSNHVNPGECFYRMSEHARTRPQPKWISYAEDRRFCEPFSVTSEFVVSRPTCLILFNCAHPVTKTNLFACLERHVLKFAKILSLSALSCKNRSTISLLTKLSNKFRKSIYTFHSEKYRSVIPSQGCSHSLGVRDNIPGGCVRIV